MATLVKNRRARHDYEITETYEAGIALVGPEIKLLAAGKGNLTGSYAKFLVARKKPELYLIGGRIGEGETADRSRKLLLHRKELSRLVGQLQEKRLSLIPLSIYTTHGKAKVELGLGRGKKLFDKRETLKKRQIERDKLKDLKQS